MNLDISGEMMSKRLRCRVPRPKVIDLDVPTPPRKVRLFLKELPHMEWETVKSSLRYFDPHWQKVIWEAWQDR
jgi:hypothetical protein